MRDLVRVVGHAPIPVFIPHHSAHGSVLHSGAGASCLGVTRCPKEYFSQSITYLFLAVEIPNHAKNCDEVPVGTMMVEPVGPHRALRGAAN